MDAFCGLASVLLGRDVKTTGRRLADVGLGGRDMDGIMAALRDGYTPT
jgi:hypothetical protein